jgi:hypothetical protein
MQRELAYVQHVLQPYFAGCSCQLAVASAHLVEPPLQLLSALQANGHDLQQGVMGLLMQDSSVLTQGGGWVPSACNVCLFAGGHWGGWQLQVA